MSGATFFFRIRVAQHVCEDGKDIVDWNIIEDSGEGLLEISGRIELRDHITNIAVILHAGYDEDAVGALVGEEFCLSRNEAVFVAGARGSSCGLRCLRILWVGGSLWLCVGAFRLRGIFLAEHLVEDFNDAFRIGALELNELGDDTGRFDIDQIKNSKSLSDHRGFVREDDGVGIWNRNHGTVGVDLHDALHDSDGFFWGNEGERLVKAQHLVAICWQGLNLAQ